ncbi:hypothetical protein HOK51_04780 [Candidatus Woesearchaeota archaeon]|jgi:hypothetical protein|nr:hypothetical protein [Candidatus Woesearchaeota archaeon]MBT6519140.1 hypothetical protein [Candidatus Woesearchaeota archaeon]MBT7367773.1 hypothetical protein [Candidatus Woesearchaeota archaeon]
MFAKKKKIELQEKDECYKTFAKELETTDQLREILEYVMGDNIRLHTEQYRKEYFEKLSVPYETKQDLDLLSIYLSTELDSRGDSEALDVVNQKIGRRSLEQLMTVSLEEKFIETDDLDKLKKPLDQLFTEMYNSLVTLEYGTYTISKKSLKDSNVLGNLFYFKDLLKVGFGTGYDRNTPGQKTDYGKFGLLIKLKKKKKMFSKEEYIKVKIWSLGSDKVYVSRSADQYIEHLKSEASNLRNTRSKLLDYLGIMLKFPNYIINSNKYKKQKVNEQVKSLKNQMKKLTQEPGKK